MPQHPALNPFFNDVRVVRIARLADEVILDRLVTARWGGDHLVSCPHCGSADPRPVRASEKARTDFRCRMNLCRMPFNVTTGTVLEGTKLSHLTLYLALAAFVMRADETVLDLMTDADVSYKTAFSLAARFRSAIQWHHDRQEKLSGDLEGDGAVFCHRIRPSNLNMRRKANYAAKKASSMAAWVVALIEKELVVENDEPRRWRASKIKVFVVDHERTINLRTLLMPHIESGSRLRTDGLAAYKRLASRAGLKFPRIVHESVDHDVEFQSREGVNENIAESFHGLVRRMVYARNGVSPTYLAEYAKEAAWRRVHNNKRASERLHLLAQACLTAPLDPQLVGYTHRSQRTDYELYKMDGEERNGIAGRRLSPPRRLLDRLAFQAAGDRQYRVFGGNARRKSGQGRKHNGGCRQNVAKVA